ncbi:FAD-binding domain-containing protein [Aspergillus pseudodeflectus]|uniref:FAD-binding domain-containing protein n=1 Tax=Aspergillus pseudodeflectus TaxID=176178 RepID=A0ABR4K2F7_9EURO
MYLPVNYVFLTHLLLLTLITNCTSARTAHCRCLPTDPCWPDPGAWDEFNRTINGHLISLRPIGAACHGPEYNETRCEIVKDSTHNPLWRISEPAAYQWTNWESEETILGVENGGCPISAPRDTPCHQGRISLYAIMAHSAEEVQAAIRFAKQHNLRVTIRNTGHDGMGRSSGLHSVQINVSRLKTIQFVDDFVPRGGDESDSEGRAVIVGAGVLGIELQEASQGHGLNVMTGVCRSVGAVGGFLQGGGTSLLAPSYGLAADNALQFTVVTAEGELVVANRIENPDLFWALRGGGGGTFGVIIDVTIRTFPDIPIVYALLITSIMQQNETSPTAEQSLWEITGEIASLLPDLKRQDNKTSAIIVPVILADRVALTAAVMFLNSSDTNSAETHFTRLRETLDTRGIPYLLNVTNYPQLSTYLNEPGPMHQSGIGQIEGSVLISENLFFKPDGTSEIVGALAQLHFQPGDSVEILMSAGGQVKANKDTIHSALQPAWRESALGVTIRRNLSPDSPIKIFGDSMLSSLRGLESPYLGSYWNVADPDEPEPQRAFWGTNYGRLYGIKQKWDPDGLFIIPLY